MSRLVMDHLEQIGSAIGDAAVLGMNLVIAGKLDAAVKVMSLGLFRASSDLFYNEAHLLEIELHFSFLNLKL